MGTTVFTCTQILLFEQSRQFFETIARHLAGVSTMKGQGKKHSQLSGMKHNIRHWDGIKKNNNCINIKCIEDNFS